MVEEDVVVDVVVVVSVAVEVGKTTTLKLTPRLDIVKQNFLSYTIDNMLKKYHVII